jgi:hypothetical protein
MTTIVGLRRRSGCQEQNAATRTSGSVWNSLLSARSISGENDVALAREYRLRMPTSKQGVWNEWLFIQSALNRLAIEADSRG